MTISARWIASEDNSLADALSRGSPFDELRLRGRAWRELEERYGPHTVDRYARASNARTARWEAAVPTLSAAGATGSSRWPRWEEENNYAFPPPVELPRLAQRLQEAPHAAATVVAP